MVYRFGVFEVDEAAAELRRNGLLIRLQDQPVRILIALLEANGQIVTKDQLRARIWAQGVHVEVDGALSVAVAKLREALKDDAANPRFIETVPRRGYRFIAPIERVNDDPPIALVASGEHQTATDRRPRSAFVWLIVAVLLLAGFAAYKWARPKLGDPVHSLIVTEFANSTGDAVFDGSLRRAAIVQLSQSPWLHIDSDTAIDNALQSLNRPPARGRVTPEMAGQACQPLQADAIAEKAKIKPGYLGEIERGEKWPSLDVIVRIAQGVGVSPALFLESDQPTTDPKIGPRYRSTPHRFTVGKSVGQRLPSVVLGQSIQFRFPPNLP